MYTNKEQSEKLLAAGIERDSCDMAVFAGRSKTDPYKNWKPEPKQDNTKKEWMPVWSDDALLDMLPNIINDPENDTRYKLNVNKVAISGLGIFKNVSYINMSTGKPWRAFMNKYLTQALCNAVREILCGSYEIGNFSWNENE